MDGPGIKIKPMVNRQFFKTNNHKPQVRAALLWLLPVAFLIIFFYQPLIAIFKLIFSAQFSASWSSFNWNSILKPLGFTFYQATLSTLLTLLLGLPSAYIFSHFNFAGKKLMRLLTTISFILPTVVVAAGFNALLGPRGWLNLGLMALFGLDQAPIQFLNTFPAILLAHVFYNTTIIIRIVGSAWAGQNDRLEQAAQMLGAHPWRAFREITLPMLSPAIAAASLLVFLFNFTSFGVVLMLGGPQYATLEVEIYTQAFHMLNLPLAGLLSLVQLACTLGITVLYNRLSQTRASNLMPVSQAETLRRPTRVWEKVMVGVVVVILFVLIASPLLALSLRSVVRLEAARGERAEVTAGFTLAYYRELFVNRQGSLFYVPPIQAMRNSLTYSILTVLISVSMGTLVAYAMDQRSRLNRWLDPFIMLPLGASAVTLGLGFIVVFNMPPWNQPEFPLLVPIAHSLVALPFVVRSLLPTLRNIPPSLRQAAGMLGASPLQVFREVDLPILMRALLVSAVFAFTISLGEFGASSFITTPENPTIPVAIYRYISQPGALNYGQALAMSTLLMAVCTAGIWLIEKVRLPGEEVF
jgi:thiamine transport system permease protein